MKRKWIRRPGEGQKRGAGTWELVTPKTLTEFERHKANNTLPAAWELEDWEKVKDQNGRTPNFVLRGGDMTHQFHEIAIRCGGSPAGMRASQKQLVNLIREVLVVDMEITDDNVPQEA